MKCYTVIFLQKNFAMRKQQKNDLKKKYIIFLTQIGETFKQVLCWLEKN